MCFPTVTVGNYRNSKKKKPQKNKKKNGDSRLQATSLKISSSLPSHTPYASIPTNVPSILQHLATSLKLVITLLKGSMHKMLLVIPAVHVLPAYTNPQKSQLFYHSHSAQAIATIVLPSPVHLGSFRKGEHSPACQGDAATVVALPPCSAELGQGEEEGRQKTHRSQCQQKQQLVHLANTSAPKTETEYTPYLNCSFRAPPLRPVPPTQHKCQKRKFGEGDTGKSIREQG